MKKLLALLALCLCLAAQAEPPPITLEWDYSDPVPPDLFTLYVSDSPNTPFGTWRIFMDIPGRDVMTGQTANQVIIHLTPGRYCFYITASNFWGESEPSNVACTPFVPVRPVLRLK